jgi:hypothetical protein
MEVTNTLAYNNTATIAAIKSFIIPASINQWPKIYKLAPFGHSLQPLDGTPIYNLIISNLKK